MIESSGAYSGGAGRAPSSLHERTRALLRQHRLLRFLIAGLLNTAVGYLLFLAALAVTPGTTSALLVSTILAVIFNFVSTGSYVFGTTDPARLWRFFAVYGLVFAYNSVVLVVLETQGIGPQIGGLLGLPGAVAISYALNRAFVFESSR